MTILSRFFAFFYILFMVDALANHTIIIQKTSLQSPNPSVESPQFSNGSKEIKIALLCAPHIIGKYSQSTYSVTLATLLGKHNDNYSLKRFDIPDESKESLTQALTKIRQEGFNAILAPLTLVGAQHLCLLEDKIDVFIPTVHKRDLPDAPKNITFGSIDYVKQIQALVPYMGNSIAIFYDDSTVGNQLKKNTEMLFMETNKANKSVVSYPIDAQGDNIVSYLAKPSKFSKKSIILHIPVVKSAMLTSQLTFTGVKERNILSTQINVDPALFSLTQYNDRKNMILANSIVEHPPALTEANVLMNNDIEFDWINYTTSVGTDYLISIVTGSPREYSMRIVDAQIIYPVELFKATMYGFEPIGAN